MFEQLREWGRMVDAGQAWLLAQAWPVQVLLGIAAVAVLWVLWIVGRVFFAAFRAAFRGL